MGFTEATRRVAVGENNALNIDLYVAKNNYYKQYNEAIKLLFMNTILITVTQTKSGQGILICVHKI